MKTKTIETICESPTLVVEGLNGYQGGSYTSSTGYSSGGNFQDAYRPTFNLEEEGIIINRINVRKTTLYEMCKGLGKKDRKNIYDLYGEAASAYNSGKYKIGAKKMSELDRICSENEINLSEICKEEK